MQVYAKHNFILRGPLKIRRFAQLIKGQPLERAEAALLVNSSPACEEMLKVLKSAAANAENNFGLDRENLYVKTVMVDEGPRLKRFRARARGRPGPILKRMSHLTIVLDEIVPSSEGV